MIKETILIKIDKKKDELYLSNNTIEDIRIKISENEAIIDCPHTSWVNIRRESKITKEELEKTMRELKKQCSINKIKLHGYSKCIKYLNENWDKYVNEQKYYNEIFEKVIEISKKIKERGIHYGCGEDVYLNEATNLRNKYLEMYYRSSESSKINGLYIECENKLKYHIGKSSYSDIYLNI